MAYLLTMRVDRRSRKWRWWSAWFWYVMIVPASFWALYLFLNLAAFQQACERTADYQLLALSAELAKSGDALTGAYSRFGFRHPGPLYSYLSALSDQLLPISGSPRGRHLVGQLTFNLMLLLVAAHLAFRFFRPRIIALGITSMTLAVCRLAFEGHVLHDLWNPSVLIAPTVLFLVASAAVVRGQVSALPWQAAAGALAMHAHVGAVPIVGGMLGISFVRLWMIRNRMRGNATVAVFGAIIVGVLAFAPPIAEAFQAPAGGNFGALARFFLGRSVEGGVFESVAFIAWHLARAVGSDQPVVGVALFLACTATVWAIRRSTGARLLELAVVALAALLLSVLAARGIVGERHDYLMRYLFGVIPVLLAVALSPILMRYTSRKVAVALLLAVAMFSLPPALRRESKPCLVNARKLADLLVPQHGVRYRLAVSDPKDWPLLSAMALVFQRKGIPVCVDQQWSATFDWSFTCAAQSADEGFPPRPLRTIMLYNRPPLTPPALPHVVRRKGFVMAWE